MKQLTEQLIQLFDWVWSVSTMTSVLVVLIIGMQKVLKHRLKPRWHYLMWLLVIVRLILPWGLESEFSIYNWVGYTDSVHSAIDVNQEVISQITNTQPTAAPSMYRILFAIWLIGVCSLGTYTIWINRKFARKIQRETVMITDARIRKLFNRSKVMMSFQRPIVLLQSDEVATPTLFGLIKPKLIMPRSILNSLNDDQLQHVFLHELAHSKRNDIAINWLMHVLLIIHWFNPILWYANRRMQEDQEIASDALALNCLPPEQSQDYGYTLIKLLENFTQPRRVAGNVHLSGNKGQLQRRITMIKQFKSNSYRWSFLGLATILIISGCTLTNPKGTETAAPQASSTKVSEEKSTPTVPQTTPTGVTTQQTDLAGGIQTPAADSKPKSETSAAQSAVTVEKTRPAASDGTVRVIPTENTRATAPVVEQPAAVSDQRQQPRAVPSVKELPSDSGVKPKAAASVRSQPSAAKEEPQQSGPVRALPQVAEDKPTAAPAAP
ncbi:hypothetical protein GCM10008018_10410 [Paenibacillus marchantiophytorum]|uniref:Peptidase M56 domain-containing protein n=1 Tax=Paenibacillus marchantiophytorum TaxID=1619310 RepID=A0ABQ2BSZ8_9BACL|nr:M56 family metallopeptidase [Paenibacillus marchantiophytorum]GGI45101.1 hypothetical protein GCM10008018_10410 [Paenibacillus marchantiophytorum]